MIRRALFAATLPLAIGLETLPLAAQDVEGSFPRSFLAGFRFRPAGPAVTGGRIHDVEALPDDPSTIYIASASGGIWKSTNKGTTWSGIFQDQPVSTFGDLAIAPSNPQVLYAGTGEQNNRQSTSWGNGVYRSDDGGTMWRHLGLDETRHIGRVRVHPSNPEIAYVAALGNLWAPSTERGVFKTTDGGRGWQKVLYVDTLTGAVDLVMDPANPDVLYAATYQRLRRAWGFNGGGPGSGIHRSTDGGATWTQLTNGIPAGDKGRIGLALAHSNPRVLNATIEHATEGGLYRSTDGGETWQKVNDTNQRPMYYSHIYIDPTNENRLYKLATSFYRSDDGGRDLRRMPIAPTYDVGVHADYHALWIDPGNPSHFYLGGDAGLYETWDMGEHFIRMNNLPIGQFYAIGLDMRDPYWVYGGMQDNHSWMGPSATRRWVGIIGDDWRQIGFGDGMYQQVDPTSHRYVYSNSQNGNYTRVDAETGDILDIAPLAPAGEEYRYDWVSPSLVSKHFPNVVYLGGNRLFISRDRGHSWEATNDLTRRTDRDTLRIMGVRGSTASCGGGPGRGAQAAQQQRTGPCVLSKNDGESSFAEITTIAESPLSPNILWIGTDDGAVRVSQDAGKTWTEVGTHITGDLRSVRTRERAAAVLPGRPRLGTYVSRVIASASAPGVAYVTLDAHRDGDFQPYAFRTEDFGRTWTPIVEGLDPSGSVRVILEDPSNANVHYLGTEHALYASSNGGRSWTKFMANLPTTTYIDLKIHPREHDLVVATHGRSIWILDDARPLALLSAQVTSSPLHLFPIRRTTTLHYWKDTSYRGHGHWNGENPPDGAILSYWLGRAAQNVTVTIAKADTAADSTLVRRLTGETGQGLHRLVWDLRHEPPRGGGGPGGEQQAAQQQGERDPLLVRDIGPRGPFVSPGAYTVTIEADGNRAVQTVEVRGDPALPISVAQAQAREEFLVDVAAALERARTTQQSLTQLRNQLRDQSSQRQRLQRVEQMLTRVQAASRLLGGIATAFNGGGVRPGSMYPPTQAHLDALDQASEALEQAETLLGT